MTIRVFLVEDLPATRDLLVDLLSSIGGYRVVGTAASEAEANLWLEECRDRWDLLVVDLVLAEGSGLGVVPRARKWRPQGDIVVLSAFGSPGIEQHLMARGVKAVFDKAHTTAFAAWLTRHAADHERPGQMP